MWPMVISRPPPDQVAETRRSRGHFEVSARAYQAGGLAGRGMSRAGISETETSVTWLDPTTCASGASDGPWRSATFPPDGSDLDDVGALLRHEGDVAPDRGHGSSRWRSEYAKDADDAP